MYGRISTAQLVHVGGVQHSPWYIPPGGRVPRASWWLCRPRAICLRLFEQLIRAAASRTFWTAGSSRPMRIAMMAMTTSNSISVNADRDRRAHPGERGMIDLRDQERE